MILENLIDFDAATQKQEIRSVMREASKKLDYTIRVASEEKATARLKVICEGHAFVLSYASFGQELGTWKLNEQLAKEGRLLLPRVHGNDLLIYQVADIKTNLSRSNLGILEPIPELCQEVSKECLTLMLVPGLAFDRLNFRLGYGKGFYDRFCSQIGEHVVCFGVGFKHQLLMENYLPIEPHDVPLSKTYLF